MAIQAWYSPYQHLGLFGSTSTCKVLGMLRQEGHELQHSKILSKHKTKQEKKKDKLLQSTGLVDLLCS